MKRITAEKLNHIESVIRSGNDRYAVDELTGNNFFNKAFKKYPLNNTPELVAMKISLIDTTNSTNLNRILGNKNYMVNGEKVKRKVFTLSDLINKIISTPNFDKRIRQGDISLVSELTKWSKEHGANIMSFFSKYCLYHNYICYNKDDFSIFDSVLQNNLGKYITEQEFEQLFPNRKIRTNSTVAKATSNEISKMKNNCDYESYRELIDNILKLRKITQAEVPKIRRKLDLFVWYLNR